MAATYRVIHTTTYNYASAARESINEMHLSPAAYPEQTVVCHAVDVTPTAILHKTVDCFANPSLICYHPGSVSRLSLRAESVIAVRRTGHWPERVWSKATYDDAIMRDRHFLYLMPTPRCKPIPYLKEWLGTLWSEATDVTSFLLTLTDRVFEFFTYTPGVTHVNTGIEQLSTLRAGVCQDYSHWMLSVLRSIGIPCRYVSGYLYDAVTDGTAYKGAQAMHAWIDVLVAEDTWIGLDPTNRCVAGENHIYLCTGREYADITPIKGVFQGTLRDMTVDLMIERQRAEVCSGVV